jgi:hypothetical protein
MAKLSSHCSTHAFNWPSRKIAAREAHPALVCPPQKPSAAARPSASDKGGSGVSPDYDNPARTHAEEDQAERSGESECSGEGGFGGLP